jgi:hypothetical protein
MRHEDAAVVEAEEDVLSLAVDLRDLPALEARGELLALGMSADHAHRVLGRTDLRLLDPASDHVLLEIPPHHLDFG